LVLKKENRNKYCSVDREDILLQNPHIPCRLLGCTLNIEDHSVPEISNRFKITKQKAAQKWDMQGMQGDIRKTK
jgi:hypothetical protein